MEALCKVLTAMLFLPCPTPSTLSFNRRGKGELLGVESKGLGLNSGFVPCCFWGEVLSLSEPQFLYLDMVGGKDYRKYKVPSAIP